VFVATLVSTSRDQRRGGHQVRPADVTIFLLIASSCRRHVKSNGPQRGQRRRRSATASVALASERRLHGSKGSCPFSGRTDAGGPLETGARNLGNTMRDGACAGPVGRDKI
jgi:hypothetical protein